MRDAEQSKHMPEGVALQQGHMANAFDLPTFYDDESDGLDDLGNAPHQPWWRQRRWIAALAAVLLLVLIVGTVAAVAHARANQVTYLSQAVTQGNLVTTVSATGPLQSGLYDVNFTGSGKIAAIAVSVGQQVTAGQVLAKLDPTSLQDAVNSAQDAVNSAQTALDNAYSGYTRAQTQAQAQLTVAYDQEQVTLGNCRSGDTNCTNAAYAQYNSAQAQASAQTSSAQAQIASAQAQVASAQTALTTAQQNLGNAVLTAPHAGIVGAINGAVGGTPGASSSSGSSSSSSGSSAFIEIVDLTSLQITADVNEADISKVAVGQPVTFTVSAYGSQRFQGTVASISPLGQTTSSVVTYPVIVTVNTQTLRGAKLLPDMTATLTITTASRPNVLLVPAQATTFARTLVANGTIPRASVVAVLSQAAAMYRAALRSDPTAAQDNVTASFIVERAHNAWVVKPVVLGLSDGVSYEVLAGLATTDRVITGQQGGSASTASSSTAGKGSSLLPTGGGGRFLGGGGARGGSGTSTSSGSSTGN